MTGARRTRGWAVIEGVIALAVIVILLGSTHVAGITESRFVQDVARRNAVRDAAAAHLERIRARPHDLSAGTFDLEVGAIPSATAEQVVRQIAPGLFEVSVSVRGDGVECTLTTLVAQETGR